MLFDIYKGIQMYKSIHWLFISVLLLTISGHSAAKTVKKINSYGIYVVAKKGYVKVTPYNHNYDNFVDFKYLNEIASVKRGSKKVKLIVYTTDFKQGNYLFQTRPIQSTVQIDDVSHSVKPMKKKGMYMFTLDKSIADGNMLHVFAPEISGRNMGAIVLGNTQKELVKYFSNKKHEKAYAELAYLEDSLKAFPKNKKLKALLPYWQQAAKDEKDIKAYGYVDEKWRKYQKTTKIHLKVHYLEGMISEINGYLRDHPKGKKAVEAKQRKVFAENKIKEYKPLH